MNEISCDICMDLLPLVTDSVASEDSKNAVLSHIETCESCRNLYTKNEKPSMDTAKVMTDIKKRLFVLAIALVVVGVAFGLTIAGGEFMFYNIFIIPTIGAISYFALKKKGIYVLVLVFLSVYFRWLPDTFGYIFEGNIVNALVPPLWWAAIYSGLFILGIIIAFLLHFGLKKEKYNEENN